MDIIVGKTAGFCFGVKRAVEGCFNQIESNTVNKQIYCFGELVHNRQVVNRLENKGIKFINNINQVKGDNSSLIIRAHGVPKEEYENAKLKQIKIIDYTCPYVLKIHNIVEQYKNKGFYIFVVGNKQHPEVIGTISYCGGKYSVIEDEKDIEYAINSFLKEQNNNLLVIVQTTFNKEKFGIIENNIRKSMNSNIHIEFKNTICSATEERQKETEKISKEVNLMIIIGGKNSSNTKKLYEISKNNTKTLLIETSEELDIESIKEYDKVGIMAGASTPKESIDEVIESLKYKAKQ